MLLMRLIIISRAEKCQIILVSQATLVQILIRRMAPGRMTLGSRWEIHLIPSGFLEKECQACSHGSIAAEQIKDAMAASVQT
jgi:hypothetical protein